MRSAVGTPPCDASLLNESSGINLLIYSLINSVCGIFVDPVIDAAG